MRLINKIFLCFVIYTAFANFHVGAETVDLQGRVIRLKIIDGFCNLGDSPAERELERSQAAAATNIGKVVLLAVPCTELESFRRQEINAFSNWIQVNVLMPRGKISLIQKSRNEFVRSLAGSLANKPLNVVEANRRLQQRINKASESVAISSAEMIGATADAVFFEATVLRSDVTSTYPVFATGATTTIDMLPVGIYTFTTPDSKLPSPLETTQAMLKLLLSINP